MFECVRDSFHGQTWLGIPAVAFFRKIMTEKIFLRKRLTRFDRLNDLCSSGASLPYTGPDLLSIDQSNRYICLASQRTQRMETHFCLALANQEALFCLALLSIAPHLA